MQEVKAVDPLGEDSLDSGNNHSVLVDLVLISVNAFNITRLNRSGRRGPQFLAALREKFEFEHHGGGLPEETKRGTRPRL